MAELVVQGANLLFGTDAACAKKKQQHPIWSGLFADSNSKGDSQSGAIRRSHTAGAAKVNGSAAVHI